MFTDGDLSLPAPRPRHLGESSQQDSVSLPSNIATRQRGRQTDTLQPAIPVPGTGGMIAMGGSITKTLAEGEVNSPSYRNLENRTERILPLQQFDMTSKHSISRKGCCPSSLPRTSCSEHSPLPLSAAHSKTNTEPRGSNHSSAPTEVSHAESLKSIHCTSNSAMHTSDSTKPHSRGRRNSVGSFNTEDPHSHRGRTLSRKISEQDIPFTSTPEIPAEKKCPDFSFLYRSDRQTHSDRQGRSRMLSPNAPIQNQNDSGISRQNAVKRSNSLPSKSRGTSFSCRNLSGLPRITELDEEIPSRNPSVHKSNLVSKSQTDQGALEPAKKGCMWKNSSKTSAVYMTIKETISRKKGDRNPHLKERFTNVREENVTQVLRVKKTCSEVHNLHQDCDNHLRGSREGKSYLTDKRTVVKEFPNKKEARHVNKEQIRPTRENVEAPSKEQVWTAEDTVYTERCKEGEIRNNSSDSPEVTSFENRIPLTTIEEYESDKGTKEEETATKLNDIQPVDENQDDLQVNNMLPERKLSDRANVNENSSCKDIPEIIEVRTSRDNLSLREGCLERSADNNFPSEPVIEQICYLDNENNKVSNRTMGEIASMLRERRSCSSSPKRKRSIFVNVQTKDDGRNNVRNGERSTKRSVAEDDSLPLPPTPDKLLQSSSETSLLLPSSHRIEDSHDDFTANLAAAKNMLRLETIKESCAVPTSTRRLEPNSPRDSPERRSDVHNNNQRVSSPQRNCKNNNNNNRKYNYSSGNRDNLCKKEIRGEREINGRKVSTDHSKEMGSDQIPVNSNRSNSRNEIPSKSSLPLRRTETHRGSLNSPSNSRDRNDTQSFSTRRVIYQDFQERTRSPPGREPVISRNFPSQSNVYQGNKRFSLTSFPVTQRERISSPNGRAISMQNTSYKGNTVEAVGSPRLETRKEYSVETGRRVNSKNSSTGKLISNSHTQQPLRNSKPSAFRNEKRYTSPCSEEDISNLRLYETRPISSFSGEVLEKARQGKVSSSKCKFDSQLDISKSRKTDTELRHNRTAAANVGFKSQHENYVDFSKRGKSPPSYPQEYGKELSESRLPDLHLKSRYEENYLPELESVYPGIRTSALKENNSVAHGRSRSVEPSIDSLRVRCSSESDLEERYHDGSSRSKRRNATPSRIKRAMGKRSRSGEEGVYSCKKSDSYGSIAERTEISFESHHYKRSSPHHNEDHLNTTDEWKEYPQETVTVNQTSVSIQLPVCEPQSRDGEGSSSGETDSDGLRQEVIKRRRQWIAGSLESSYRGEHCSSDVTCSSVSFREDKLRPSTHARRESDSSPNCHEDMIERTPPADKPQTAAKGVFSRNIYQQGQKGYCDIHDGRKSENTQSLSSFSHISPSETGNRSKSVSSQDSSNNSAEGYRPARNTHSSVRKMPSIPAKDFQREGRNAFGTSPVKGKKTQLRENDPRSLRNEDPFISSKGTRRRGEINSPEEDEEQEYPQFVTRTRVQQMGPAFGIHPKMISDQKKKIKRRAQSSAGPSPNYFEDYPRSKKHVTGASSDSELRDVLDRPRSLSDSVRSGEVPSYKKALAIFERKSAEARKEYEQSIYKFREMRLKQKYREWDDPPLPALPGSHKLL